VDDFFYHKPGMSFNEIFILLALYISGITEYKTIFMLADQNSMLKVITALRCYFWLHPEASTE